MSSGIQTNQTSNNYNDSPNARFLKRMSFLSPQTEEIFRLISEIDTVKGQWEITNQLSPQLLTRLTISSLLTSAGSSNRIEGNKLTDNEVKELYNDMRIQKLKNRDQQEVAGYIEILKIIFEQYSSIKFSESTILNIHKELLKYVEKDQRHRGNYKFESNRVEANDSNGNLIGMIFDPTPPFLVPKEMQELVEFTVDNFELKTKHPLIILTNFIFEFLAIHPFRDGNGRTSRLLTNLLLLKLNYKFAPIVSHEKYVEENKADYYLALNAVQQTWKTENENLYPFSIFLIKIIHKQAIQALKILTQEDVEKLLSDKQIEVWRFAIQNTQFTKSQAVEATGLNQRTVEQSIKKLVSMNKLEQQGSARSTRYVVIKSNNSFL